MMSPVQSENHDLPPTGFSRFFRRKPGDASFRLKEPALIVAISVFMTVAYNRAFFGKVFEIYPLGVQYLLFHAALFVIVAALTAFVFALVGSKYTTKPFVAFVFIASSVVSYFVNNYGIVVDDDMLRNALETNWAESLDLLSVKLGLYVLFLGVVPAMIVWRTPVEYGSWRQAIGRKAILAVASLVIIVV